MYKVIHLILFASAPFVTAVTPVKAGVHIAGTMDARLRGHDD